MSSKPDPNAAQPERLSLERWSRRKLDATRVPQQKLPAEAAEPPPAVTATPAPVAGAAQSVPAELPPIESLSPESDFTAFFQRQGKVDEALKRAALKQLLRDPRFNVMDGLDTYVGDYTQSDPIPDEVLKRLVQARAIFNPPKTMVTPEGHVIDVPPDADAAPPEAAPIEHTPLETAAQITIQLPVAEDSGKTGEGTG